MKIVTATNKIFMPFWHFRNVHSTDPPIFRAPQEQTEQELYKEIRSKVFLIGIDEVSCIIASVRGYKQGETAHIERLIVRPEQQRKGYGTLMLTRIIRIKNMIS